jgi:predicted RNA-binding protein with PIN domain
MLIDAWNVLHQTGVLPPDLAGVGLKGLSALIQKSRWANERVLLVCDGTPSSPHMGLATGIRAVFSGHEREADDLIESQIATSTAPRRLTVVSSDRRVKSAARKRGCKVLSSQAFLERLVYDAQAPKKTHPKRPTKVDFPTDLVAEAKALIEEGPKPRPIRSSGAQTPATRPTTVNTVPLTPPRDDLDSGPLPKSIIDAARKLLEEG